MADVGLICAVALSTQDLAVELPTQKSTCLWELWLEDLLWSSHRPCLSVPGFSLLFGVSACVLCVIRKWSIVTCSGHLFPTSPDSACFDFLCFWTRNKNKDFSLQRLPVKLLLRLVLIGGKIMESAASFRSSKTMLD